MAIARLSMKVGKGGKAAPHAAYIARQGQYTHRLKTGEKLEATEAGNMPTWARKNTQQFWLAADAYERKNGTTYREMEIALPRELEPAQRAELVRAFVRQEIGETHAYQWAIHTPKAADDGEQPHLHLMFSERQLDGIERDPEHYFKRYNAKAPEKGGSRKGYGPRAGQTLTAAERAADLKELRGRWQDMANEHLERAGLSERIDMRSNAERGINELPEAKQLPSQWRGAGKTKVLEWRAAKRDQEATAEQVRELIPDVVAEIVSLEAERQCQKDKQQIERAKKAQEQIGKLRQQAEDYRIARMTADELKAEIISLRPKPLAELVKSDQRVTAAKAPRNRLNQKYQQAKQQEATAKSQAEAWRKAHPVIAKAHDAGGIWGAMVWGAAELGKLIEAEAQARSERQRLKPELDAAIKSASAVQVQVQAEVHKSQGPARNRVEELERVFAQRQAAELAKAQEMLDAQKAQDLEAERQVEEAQRDLERTLKKRFNAP